MKRLLAVVLWSVIAAAFIGPGTVTTCAVSGASHGVALLWALGFSIVATLVLQEASARLTSASGRDLARALRESYRGGPGGAAVLVLVIGAIGLGCAAYEAGNLLGAAAGAELILGIRPWILALAAGLLAAGLLWLGAPKAVAHALAALVALMGVAFLLTALFVLPPAGELLRGLVVPRAPAGAGLLVLGLVGTTVVPYNLFLGSGLAAGQELGEIRFGLGVAVVLGGLISMGVVVVGASLAGPFAFDALAAELSARLGPWAAHLFGWGLAAAGLTSAVTAPLAAALTARGLFGEGPEDPRWEPASWRYRAVWLAVLAVGVGFGVSSVRPVPAILLAQAFNGVLLPVAAIFLFVAVNDRRLMGSRALNGAFANAVTTPVVAVTVVLGTSGVLRAGAATLGRPAPGQATLLTVAALVVAVVAYPVTRAIARRRAALGRT
ncbi:MAG: divalent metal cation transporter [Acidobacteriota bacterium]